MLKKGLKVGKKIDEIEVGERILLTETIQDRDMLLYLGLTNDNNPLYIQHDYASNTPFKKPIVPTILLNGMIHSAISKYLPGPGSHIVSQQLQYLGHVYHHETIEIHLEVQQIVPSEHKVKIKVMGFNEQQQNIIEGLLIVSPPY